MSVDDSSVRLVGIVEGLEFQHPAMDAAPLVHLVERRLDAQPHILSQLLGRTAEGSRLAEKDTLIGDTCL